jgi:4-hydroxyphenylpyruvate dioxygenase
MGFRVRDGESLCPGARTRRPAGRGAHRPDGTAPAGHPGIGGSIVYLIDRYGDGLSIYDIDFVYLEGVDRHPAGAGLKVIDHLTHNVYGGRMAHWAASTSACSVSARSAISTSRANIPASARR